MLYLIIIKALSSKLIQKQIQFQLECTGNYKDKSSAMSLVYMKILTELTHCTSKYNLNGLNNWMENIKLKKYKSIFVHVENPITKKGSSKYIHQERVIFGKSKFKTSCITKI